MYRTLLKDTSLYSISTVVARGFSFITVPIFTRILSASDYGALDLLSYAAMFIPLIFGLALDQAIGRFYIGADEDNQRRIASTVILYYIVVLFFISLAGMPFAGYLAEYWLDNQVDAKTVVMVFVYMWVLSVYYASNNQLKYMFESKNYALTNVGNTVLSAVLGILFTLILRLGVFGLFLGQSISLAVFSLISLYFGRKTYTFVFDWAHFREMTRYSLPLVPSTIAFFGMQCADRYALKELGSLTDVGIYGVGARLASIIQLFLMGFQGAWYPLMIKNHANPEAKDQFRQVFNHFIFIMSAVLIIISLFGKEILTLLATSRFSSGFIVVPLLIGSSILATIANYFSCGIELRKKTIFKTYMNIAGLILNIILNIVFIRHFGLLGAALATFITLLMMAVAGMTISQRLFYVPYEWGKVVVTLVVAMAVSLTILVYPFPISACSILFRLFLWGLSLIVFSEIIGIVSLRKMWFFGHSLLSIKIIPAFKARRGS
jgi:O-antigen/teichoic acid export membrane protein